MFTRVQNSIKGARWGDYLGLRRIAVPVLAGIGLLSTALVPSTSYASTALYVSPTGVDGGSCSSTAPCASLQYATSLAGPGTTVNVLPGTYGPQVITANGTATAPVVVQGSVSGSVTLTRPVPASASLQSTPLLQIANSSNLLVQGFAVVGMKGRPDYLSASQPYGGEVVIQDHSTATGMNITLNNMGVVHANQTCIKTEDQETNVVVSNSGVGDCGQPGNGLDHGIYMTGPQSSVINTTVNSATGYGIHFWGTATTNATVKGNTVTNATYAGILVQGTGAVITGNTIQHNAWGISGYPGATITHNAFIKNTVNNGGTNSYGILFSQLSGDDIENNTFYQDGTEIQSNGGSNGTSIIKSNIFFGLNQYSKADSAYGTGDAADYNDYYGVQAPASPGTHSISSNPKFMSAPTNLQLGTGSPCIHTGLGGTDMGAY